MKRRQFAALAGATVATSTGIYINTRPAEGASVELGTLDVPDTTVATAGDEIQSIELTVDAEYQFESSHNPDSWTLELLVGDSEDTMQPIDSVTETEELNQSGSGTETLNGPITSTYHFSTHDFEPSNGGEVSRPVWVGIRFALEANGETIADERLADAVTVTVDGATLEASASLGGSGEISVSTV